MHPPDERGQLDERGRVALALNASSRVRSGSIYVECAHER